jgi:hypothetical protein
MFSRKLLISLVLGLMIVAVGCSTLKSGYHAARSLAGKVLDTAQKIGETKPSAQPAPSAADLQQEEEQLINAPEYVPSPADIPVFRDQLADGWSSWSWGSTINMENTAPIHSGSKSISVQHTEAWSALYLHIDNAIQTEGFTEIRFWLNGGPQGGQKIAVKAIDDSNGNWDPMVTITAKANTWIQVTVPLEKVGSPETIGGLIWQEYSGKTQPVYYVDDITLVARKGPPLPTSTPSAGPALKIDVQAARHPISPLIYGMSYADEALAKELRIPVNRWGGNTTTTYNWQIDVHNTGQDWFFENIPDKPVDVQKLPDGSTADQFVEQNKRTGTQSLITIPMIGWTPKQRKEDHPYDCSYKVTKYGVQQYTDQWDSDCGNGVNKDGKVLTTNDPKDAYKPVDPAFVQDWIKHLTGKYGTADQGGVTLYNLDNEPMLWSSTHRDIHPKPTTYDELRDRTYAYASALKAVDPKAQTLGPVFWGWCAYFYSAADNCKPGADRLSHGGMDLVPWYLQQMKLYETKNKVRILDYLDLHIYPQGEGVYGAKGSSATQALRLRSTRALWDRSYTDETWIAKPIYLIPRMHEWVDKYYPGTKLALTEYSWGAIDSLNGALAQADILGIFGREGLDLATLWWNPKSEDPGAYAFRMYRNYDGKGSAFGETSFKSASDDQDRLAVYAAQRTSDKALTIIVINKTSGGLTSSVSYANFTPAGKARVFRYSADNLKAIVAQPDLSVGSTGFLTTFPANSITLFVIAPK